MTSMSLVHVVDDDRAVRDSLSFLLDIAGYRVVPHESAEHFLAAAALDGPGCAVVDVRMPGMSGMELQQELNRRQATLPVVVITGHADVAMAVAALKAGAIDFIEKPFDDEVLLAAVRSAIDRGRRNLHLVDLRQRLTRLTDREREVMGRIVAGHANKVIGATLGISIRTVEIHRARVMEKMAARSLSELVRMALALEFGVE